MRFAGGYRFWLAFAAGAGFASTFAAPLYGLIAALGGTSDQDTFRMVSRMYDGILPYTNGGFEGPYAIPGSYGARRLKYPRDSPDDPDVLLGPCEIKIEMFSPTSSTARLGDAIFWQRRRSLIRAYDRPPKEALNGLNRFTRSMLDQCVRHSLLAPVCQHRVESLAQAAVTNAWPELERVRKQAERETEEVYCAALHEPLPSRWRESSQLPIHATAPSPGH